MKRRVRFLAAAAALDLAVGAAALWAALHDGTLVAWGVLAQAALALIGLLSVISYMLLSDRD